MLDCVLKQCFKITLLECSFYIPVMNSLFIILSVQSLLYKWVYIYGTYTYNTYNKVTQTLQPDLTQTILPEWVNTNPPAWVNKLSSLS